MSHQNVDDGDGDDAVLDDALREPGVLLRKLGGAVTRALSRTFTVSEENPKTRRKQANKRLEEPAGIFSPLRDSRDRMPYIRP